MQYLQRFFHNNKYVALADQAIVSAGSFITTILLAKTLGLNDFGIYSALVLFQIFILSVNNALTTQLFQVIYPALIQKHRVSYCNGILFYQFIISIIILIIGITTYFIIPPIYNAYKSLLPIYVFCLLLFLLNDSIRKIFLTQSKFRIAFAFDIINYLLQVLLLFILKYFDHFNLLNALLIITITYIPGIFFAIIHLKAYKLKFTDLFRVSILHKSKTKWILGSSLLQWTSGYFFVVAAGWWLGAAALGALRLAQHIFGLLNILLQAIENYAIPKAVQATSKKSFYHHLMFVFLLVMIPMIIMLVLFSKKIMQIAGGIAYLDFAYVMYGLAIIYMVMTIAYPIRIAIRSEQLNKHYFIGYLITMLFSLTTFYSLITRFQLVGVLLGLFSTQMILFTYWFFILKKNKYI